MTLKEFLESLPRVNKLCTDNYKSDHVWWDIPDDVLDSVIVCSCPFCSKKPTGGSVVVHELNDLGFMVIGFKK